MHFVSTDGSQRVSFEETLRRPIPSPGHLWVPEHVPKVAWPPSSAPIDAFVNTVLEAFTPPKFHGATVNMPLKLVQREEGLAELQLFHGPTEAFKDLGCQVAAHVYSKCFSASEKRVYVATSGDTGGAVASAFAAHESGVPATILYPLGKISPYQEKQMVEIAARTPRVAVVAVEGDFDRCQKAAKTILASTPKAISANSISLARLLPQIAYHAWAAAQLPGVALVVPSGNMGNACAAVFAKQMGADISHVHIACNANDGVARYLQKDDPSYTPKPTIATPATAMDVGKPSNWARLEWLGVGPETPYVSASSTPSSTIRNYQERWGVCPHTAVGYAAAEGLDFPLVCVLATASPVKFRRFSPRVPKDLARVAHPEVLPSLSKRRLVFVGLPKTGKRTLQRRFPGSTLHSDDPRNECIVFLDCRNTDLLRSRGADIEDEATIERLRQSYRRKAHVWIVTDYNTVDQAEKTLRALLA